MRSNVLQMYAINEASACLAHASIFKIFESVENLLADGRNDLVGDQFSAADLNFATLAAAVVMPTGYGVALPNLSELPSSMLTSIHQFRNSAAGKFIWRLYQERDQAPAQSLKVFVQKSA
jgi:glutathione S-transferase